MDHEGNGIHLFSLGSSLFQLVISPPCLLLQSRMMTRTTHSDDMGPFLPSFLPSFLVFSSPNDLCLIHPSIPFCTALPYFTLIVVLYLSCCCCFCEHNNCNDNDDGGDDGIDGQSSCRLEEEEEAPDEGNNNNYDDDLLCHPIGGVHQQLGSSLLLHAPLPSRAGAAIVQLCFF